MKLFLITLLLGSVAQAQTKASFLKSYAEHAHSFYTESAKTADQLDLALQELVRSPSEKTLEAARYAYVAARGNYLMTETLRFANGPIDQDGGPEAFINSWPLDEAQIDYVEGQTDSGIINDLNTYPDITADLLRELNQRQGETNVTTGFHVIEFLLWGQDQSVDGPGARSFTDYIVGAAANADRRGKYLLVVSRMLVQDLRGLATAWNPSRADSHYAVVVDPAREKEQVALIIEALAKFAGEEMAQERLFVALDTREQEEEHSCFSDLTHLDFYYDFAGLKVLTLALGEVVDAVSKDRAKHLLAALSEAEGLINKMPTPFDQAIHDEQSRKHLLKLVAKLEVLADELRNAAKVL